MRTRGWKKVFSFTFVQYVKSKSFIVSTVIICVIVAAVCVLTNVLPNVMMGTHLGDGDSGGKPSQNSFLTDGTVYLFDEAKILAEDDMGMLAELFGERFSKSEKTLDDTVTELKASEDVGAAVQITAHTDKDGNVTEYEVRSYYSAAAKGSVDTLNGVMSELVNRRIMLNAGVDPEKYADTKISVYTSKTEAGSKTLNELQGLVNYTLPVVISLVLFMLIFAYGQIVAQSIAAEKTGRVMELLLTSVRPLAVVIGKVLAMGVVSFLQFFLVVGVSWLSFAVSAPFGWLGRAMELLKDPEVQAALSQMGQSGGISVAGISSSELDIAQTLGEVAKMITPLNIICVVVTFLLGFLVFSLIAALVGASVSRIEDLQAAMGPYSFIGVVGIYLAYFPVIFNADALQSGDASVNPVQMFSYFFPISSPFALPSAIMLGTLEMWQIFAGIGVLAASVVLIAVIVGKVYEAIILHNGNRIKFGDILKMAARK